MSDDELLPITSSVTSKKLSKIGKGIARYGVIFLPECHKNEILRSEFSDYEWRNLENIFRKVRISHLIFVYMIAVVMRYCIMALER